MSGAGLTVDKFARLFGERPDFTTGISFYAFREVSPNNNRVGLGYRELRARYKPR